MVGSAWSGQQQSHKVLKAYHFSTVYLLNQAKQHMQESIPSFFSVLFYSYLGLV